MDKYTNFTLSLIQMSDRSVSKKEPFFFIKFSHLSKILTENLLLIVKNRTTSTKSFWLLSARGENYIEDTYEVLASPSSHMSHPLKMT